jgi:hypothetical protein
MMTKRTMTSPSKKVQFLLRVEGDILSTLRGLAQENGVSTSQLLRDILREYVERLTETPPSSPTVRKRSKQWWN